MIWLYCLHGMLKAGESVRIDDMKQAELLHSQLGSDFLFPRVQWILEWEQGSYVPWGWDPAFLHQLRSAGIGEEFLLTDSQVQRIRFFVQPAAQFRDACRNA